MTKDLFLKRWKPYPAAIMRGAFYAVPFEIEDLSPCRRGPILDVKDWLDENCRGGWTHFHHDRVENLHWIAFESAEDAMMFRLTWNDEDQLRAA